MKSKRNKWRRLALVALLSLRVSLKGNRHEPSKMEFLKKRGMQIATAKSAIEAAKAEEGEFNTPWSIAQGITAHARSIGHTDVRVQLEREAGKLLQATTA